MAFAARGQLVNEYSSKAMRLQQLQDIVGEVYGLLKVIRTLVFEYIWVEPVSIRALIETMKTRSSEWLQARRLLNEEVLRKFQVLVVSISLIVTTTIYSYILLYIETS
jgi:hypothetical protein